MVNKTHILGLKAFREDTERVIKAVQNGMSFTILRRSKPIFTITAPEETGWDTVVDFTKIKKGGVPIDTVIAALKRHA